MVYVITYLQDHSDDRINMSLCAINNAWVLLHRVKSFVSNEKKRKNTVEGDGVEDKYVHYLYMDTHYRAHYKIDYGTE